MLELLHESLSSKVAAQVLKLLHIKLSLTIKFNKKNLFHGEVGYYIKRFLNINTEDF